MLVSDLRQPGEGLAGGRGDHRQRLGLALGDAGQRLGLTLGLGGLADRLHLFRGVAALGPRARGQHMAGRIEDRVEAELLVRNLLGDDADHQYTSSSSSPPAPTRTIAPLLARSLATCTMAIWACSTSRRRTGPMVSMSSRMILAARSLMLEKNMSRRASEAPFSASASWSFSTVRSRVCTPPGSSLERSSKTNISARMRSAASRLRSSRAVMKRVSVWRSKALKMSAIISWLSRFEVRAKLDMNSVRRVCSILSSISRCTGSMRSMRVTHSNAKSSGRQVSTLAACSDLIFESTTATVCGYSFFR